MSETSEEDGKGDTRTAAPYRVLARKYRPRSFDDLIGQEPMVRTLTNAFETGRIAQAWMLTGVRGVGKTTTARILARALNYKTETIDQPTIHMQEPGIDCQAIMEGRHVDVVEMDAASHTGIDDVREIIAQVRYRPVSARYKVYIIDEVHMLSTQAFNGLLKTLEEPPEHVKFVFATTEIRKVPITVLSRCQRFDLRRVDSATLIKHLGWIAGKENVAIDDDALRLIARAAEGSVRDSLSLMDQAIAHGAGTVTAEAVRDMLGLADRVRVIDLFEHLMKGDGSAALNELREQYTAGADPAVVLSDLSDFTHLVTTLRYVPEAAEDASYSPMEVERGLDFSRRLSIRTLDQVWQLLLAGLEETRQSTAPRQSAEMALIRIAHAADMPSPDELIALLRDGGLDALAGLPAPAGGERNGSVGGDAASPAGARLSSPAGSPSSAVGSGAPVQASPSVARGSQPAGHGAPAPGARLSLAAGSDVRSGGRPQGVPQPEEQAGAVVIRSLEDLAALAEAQRDSLMRLSIRRYLKPVKIMPGRLEVGLTAEAPATLVGDLMRKLHRWTGERWVVTVSRDEAGKTLDEAKAERRSLLLADAEKDPEVAAILATFPGAKVTDVRLRGEAEEEATKAELAGAIEGENLEAIPDDPAGYSFDPDREEDDEEARDDPGGDPGLDPEDPGFGGDDI